MPLAASLALSPHFTAGELGADAPTASAAVVGNLRAVAAYLEQVRAVLGVPLRVTSGYRSPADNLAVGGAPSSDHPYGLAVDFVPVGLSQFTAHDKLTAARASGELPAWDQLIFYPVEGHIHVGLGTRRRGEVRVKLAEGSLAPLTASLVATLRGAVSGTSAGLLALVVLAFLFLVVFPGLP